jgi:hypothetical protein
MPNTYGILFLIRCSVIRSAPFMRAIGVLPLFFAAGS